MKAIFIFLAFYAFHPFKSLGNDSLGISNNVAMPAILDYEKYMPFIQNKRVAIATNQSSSINGQRSIDFLRSQKVNIVKIFSGEHGFMGRNSANTAIKNGVDTKTKIPIVSLFGTVQKPSKNDLKNVDVVLFDMQDVGVRFYTYISTLHYIMEACAESKIPIIITDRPNPNDGYIDGPVKDNRIHSFIAMHPVPIVHAMTIGEYAKMINGERWLRNGVQCKLNIVAMKDYRHGMQFQMEKAPSPNLNTLRSIYLYPSLCWFGATSISDGRGTLFPYRAIGAPHLKNRYPYVFKPHRMLGMNEHPRYEEDSCFGLDLNYYPQMNTSLGGRIHLDLLIDMYNATLNKDLFFDSNKKKEDFLHFDLLVGNSQLRQQIKNGISEDSIRKGWSPGIERFKKTRKKYLLYPDFPASLQVLNYNIRHGTNESDIDHLAQVAAFIRVSNPDIVGLEEVDSVCNRSGNIDQTAYIASMSGLHGLFFRHFVWDNGAYGISLLSKKILTNVQKYRLPIDSSAGNKTVAFITADLDYDSLGIIRVAVVHMDYRSENSRIRQAHIISDILSKSPYPVIFLGDFNVSPDSEVMKIFNNAGLNYVKNKEIKTFPSNKPDKRIDYILYTPTLTSIKEDTYKTNYSDHLPLMSKILIKN